jgi:hypothetical protein
MVEVGESSGAKNSQEIWAKLGIAIFLFFLFFSHLLQIFWFVCQKMHEEKKREQTIYIFLENPENEWFSEPKKLTFQSFSL